MAHGSLAARWRRYRWRGCPSCAPAWQPGLPAYPPRQQMGACRPARPSDRSSPKPPRSPRSPQRFMPGSDKDLLTIQHPFIGAVVQHSRVCGWQRYPSPPAARSSPSLQRRASHVRNAPGISSSAPAYRSLPPQPRPDRRQACTGTFQHLPRRASPA